MKMENLANECNKVINELYEFSPDILFLGQPIDDNRIVKFENQIGYSLPLDFKYIIAKHNKISLAGTVVYGLDNESFKQASIDAVYHFEHFHVESGMPKAFLPFSPDGQGNHYCFNLAEMIDGAFPVIFWQHDFMYDSSDDAERCNVSFIDWMKEVMIGWTLEDYYYDGSPK